MNGYRAVSKATPTVHGSFRPKRDEGPRASPLARFYFNVFYFPRHSCPPAWLNEFMFFFANDEYWTGRGAHDSLSRAADTQMSPTGVAVGGDHDQIDVKILGSFGDFVRRMSDAINEPTELRRWRAAGLPGRPGPFRCDPCRPPVRKKVDAKRRACGGVSGSTTYSRRFRNGIVGKSQCILKRLFRHVSEKSIGTRIFLRFRICGTIYGPRSGFVELRFSFA